MSELEKDIKRAQDEQGPRKEYTAAMLRKIRRNAAEIYRKYEEDMKQRAAQEMFNEYEHHQYS